ncbi:hypothetical protein B1756_12595 [Natrarchaeobaculum aegyptiacum]|uniref:CARDB domain-containing protein n=1 Tax=Natrarchaeobaculum aegyptiacum TaxID=745377 RepID=A0A2Z2HZB3_9EURY|nr:hypothetical protein B1756_12595 [Natrarchaeobaculum aegyptiacum]
MAGSPFVGSVSASSTPDFEVYTPENIVEPGEETSFELELRNAASAEEESDTDPGDIPTTEARDVTVTLDGDGGPVEVKSDETPMPTMSAQALFSETFTIAVDEDADAGVHEVDVEIEYTRSTSSGAERSETETETIEVVVADEARFEAGTVTSDLVVGDRGLVAIELENTGADASDAVVRFDSPDENLEALRPVTEDSELETQGSRAYVGDWDAGENRTVVVAMELADDAVARTYPVSATVQFRDEEGVDRTAREVRVGARAAHEQSFAVEQLESDLYVGEDGTVTGNVTNEGPHAVDGAVVVIADRGSVDLVPHFDDRLGPTSNVYPRETHYAVGSLEPGESAPFEFRLGVGSEAEPGPRVLEADVRYRNADGDVRMTNEPVDLTLDVQPDRDEFAVEPVDSTQTLGETRVVKLEVTNRLEETVTDVEANVYTDDPLDDEGDDPLIPVLEPGETATVAVEVSVADDATPQTYPLRVDFRYDDERSNSQLTDTYRVPIEVVEPDDGPISALGLAVALLTLGAATAVGWRYRARLEPYVDGIPYLENLPHAETPERIAALVARLPVGEPSDTLDARSGNGSAGPLADDSNGGSTTDVTQTFDEAAVAPADLLEDDEEAAGDGSAVTDDDRPDPLATEASDRDDTQNRDEEPAERPADVDDT